MQFPIQIKPLCVWLLAGRCLLANIFVISSLCFHKTFFVFVWFSWRGEISRRTKVGVGRPLVFVTCPYNCVRVWTTSIQSCTVLFVYVHRDITFKSVLQMGYIKKLHLYCCIICPSWASSCFNSSASLLKIIFAAYFHGPVIRWGCGGGARCRRQE